MQTPDFTLNPAPPAPDPHHPLLADLTEPQRRAVTTTEGPLLVIAAAGSGKTRVISRRIAWLVKEIGIAPWNVLAITFTNKAAGEMRDRVAQVLTPRQAEALTVCTFHSLCARTLRRYAEPAFLPPHFTIYDTADQRSAIKTAMKELQINTKNFAPPAVLAAISNAKNELVSDAAFGANASDFFQRTVARIYTRYQEILARHNALDFDDLLVRTVDLLRRHEPTRLELQDRYQYLLIDEYQDTNHAQYMIAHILAASHHNICVVGDPDQSIYGWRGADLRNILDFESHHPGAQIVELGQNYRSTPQILQAADALIRRNTERRHKPLFTENPPGENLSLFLTADEEHEAQVIIDLFKQLHDQGHPWQDMAVFYRVNALTRVVEDQLLKSNIPYQVARGTAFYQRKEIKDAIAYLNVLANPSDEISLLRIINTPPRAIGDTTVKSVQAYAAARGLAMYDALTKSSAIPALSSRAASAVSRFLKLFATWRDKINNAASITAFQPGMRDIVEMVLRESNLENFYKDEKTGDEDKLANLYELVTAAQRFDAEYGEENASLGQRLSDYLQSVSLVADIDNLRDSGGAVTLMTLHAAKGLEFPIVAIIGLEEGLLPHSRSFDNPAELEEERRLCFVGITRAKLRVLLSCARYRTTRGIRERTIPSPFLREIDASVLSTTDVSGYGFSDFDDDPDDPLTSSPASFAAPAPRPAPAQRSSASPQLPHGSLVRHPQFGLGTVLNVIGAGSNARARVQFSSVGIKTLVLEYARLERVS